MSELFAELFATFSPLTVRAFENNLQKVCRFPDNLDIRAKTVLRISDLCSSNMFSSEMEPGKIPGDVIIAKLKDYNKRLSLNFLICYTEIHGGYTEFHRVNNDFGFYPKDPVGGLICACIKT